MRRRGRAALVLGGVGAVLLGACTAAAPAGVATTADPSATGASGTLGTPGTVGTSAEPPVRDPAADLVIWCDRDTKPALDTYAAGFGRQQGISVAVQATADVVADTLAATAAGRGPDIVVGDNDGLGTLVQRGVVEPVGLSPAQQAAFTKPSLRAASVGGRVYGVPYATQSLALLRNTALAPTAPASYEDLLATGRRLVAGGGATRVLLQPVGPVGDAVSTYPYLTAFGGGLFGRTDDGAVDATTVLVDSAGSVRGLAYLGELGRDGILSTDVDAAAAQSLFSTGTVPYLVTGPGALDPTRASGVRYGISALPTLEGNTVTPLLEVRMFSVSATARNDAFAQEFVTQDVTTPELQAALSRVGHRSPALTQALDEVSAADADVKAWSQAADRAEPGPALPAMASVWAALGRAEADVVSQRATAADRLRTARAEIVSGLQQAG